MIRFVLLKKGMNANIVYYVDTDPKNDKKILG